MDYNLFKQFLLILKNINCSKIELWTASENKKKKNEIKYNKILKR